MLRITDLTFDHWGRRFFDKTSVTLPMGAKIGIVGPNGAGKSTLFKLIMGELQETGGEIFWPKALRVSAVAQEHPATDVGLLDTVLAADTERAELMEKLETADPEDMGEIYARLIDIDADAAPSRAAEILVGLGFTQADMDRPMREFSGGWRMRVALAAALFAAPDFLLLDEPTNYLDLEGALWLEARLKKYPHTTLVISHDRELLNNACDHILHLTQQRLELYTGNYDEFDRMREEKARLAAATNVKIEARRAHMQKFVDRFRYKESKAKQAQARIKMIAKLPPVTELAKERAAPFVLPSPEKPLAPPLIRLEGASVGYGDKPVLKNLNLRMDIDDRIGLLGVNGAGKSTFAKMIAGALKTMEGEYFHAGKMRVGWFHQHQIEALDPDDTPLEIIRRETPDASEASRRAILASFGITFEKQETTAANLSGGERARLLLNLVAREAPHVLILDEPTNHLDIDSRRALLEALNEYEGAVILITHDRSLMEMVADRLWLTADGTVRQFEGDMDDYAKFVLDRAKQAAKQPAAEKPVEAAREKPKGGPSLSTLRRRLEEAEKTLAKATADVEKLDAELADPTLYEKDPARASKLGEDRATAQSRLDAAEADWMAAAEAVEAV